MDYHQHDGPSHPGLLCRFPCLVQARETLSQDAVAALQQHGAPAITLASMVRAGRLRRRQRIRLALACPAAACHGDARRPSILRLLLLVLLLFFFLFLFFLFFFLTDSPFFHTIDTTNMTVTSKQQDIYIRHVCSFFWKLF